jgi:hypothetical protein
MPALGIAFVGLAGGWLAPSSRTAIAFLALVLAALNGYSKAYSP